VKMKYAIVESGGKQYKAVEGATIDVDLLEVESGATVNLDNVLLLVEDETVTVGTPSIQGAAVSTTVVDHVKGPKLVIFKYSPKKRIRVKTGHRQQYTRLKIESIKAE
ncbi:MAG TPA: 50S ribosomal protein L21, partial [Anaerolineaceae bacterium]|nr:50S ribosomal protein L21 [Anaerolineaceae bacterium]